MQTYPKSLKIRCAQCQRDARRWDARYDGRRKAFVISVECHGSIDELIFDASITRDDIEYHELPAIWNGFAECIAFRPPASPPLY